MSKKYCEACFASPIEMFCPLHGAAPELLEACKTALELARSEDTRFGREVAAELEAAIQKAEEKP